MIEISNDNRVRTISFNRPEALNAMNNALYWASADALAEAEADPTVAVVVLTGTGRGFCSGQDMNEMSSVASDSRGHGFPAFTNCLAEFRKPVIAAVNGIGVGIGATMLGFCDLVFMADTARLKLPFPTLGVAPEAGSSYTFPALMGLQTASYFLYTAEWISADQALQAKLAFRVSPADSLMAETHLVAKQIAAMPIASLIATKELIVAARSDAVRQARAREDAVFARLIGGPANTEAITAFLEKRPADFTELPID